MHFEIYRSAEQRVSSFADKPWKWRLIGPAGQPVAYGEGYETSAACESAVNTVMRATASAPIRYA